VYADVPARDREGERKRASEPATDTSGTKDSEKQGEIQRQKKELDQDKQMIEKVCVRKKKDEQAGERESKRILKRAYYSGVATVGCAHFLTFSLSLTHCSSAPPPPPLLLSHPRLQTMTSHMSHGLKTYGGSPLTNATVKHIMTHVYEVRMHMYTKSHVHKETHIHMNV